MLLTRTSIRGMHDEFFAVYLAVCYYKVASGICTESPMEWSSQTKDFILILIYTSNNSCMQFNERELHSRMILERYHIHERSSLDIFSHLLLALTTIGKQKHHTLHNTTQLQTTQKVPHLDPKEPLSQSSSFLTKGLKYFST